MLKVCNDLIPCILFITKLYLLELKQISEISGYPFKIHYPDTDLESFRIVADYFKQL